MQNIRNIAIIAHVDHGKTTIVDKMLMAGKLFKEHQHAGELVMDNNDLERERGITILSKNVSITWKGTKIDRKSTRLNSSHVRISYAVFCLKKKKKRKTEMDRNPRRRRYASRLSPRSPTATQLSRYRAPRSASSLLTTISLVSRRLESDSIL